MKTSIAIQNLKCGGCGTTIKNKLTALAGVENVDIDVEQSVVSFDYQDGDQPDVVHDLLINLGYPPEGAGNNLKNKAQSFISCAKGRFAS